VKRILFVCVGNSGRSQMAEAFVNQLSRERGLQVHAASAGTKPAASLDPQVVQAMREIGREMLGQTPKLLDAQMVASADRVISMGCGVSAEACPAGTHLTEDWGLDDPHEKGMDAVRDIRDEILRRVQDLLAQE
jgi:arsenate reductase